MDRYSRNDFSYILAQKQENIKKKVPKKFPYQWSEKQLNIMADIMYVAPRIRIGNKVYRFSAINDSILINNEQFLINLFKNYYRNIEIIKEIFGYEYLDFNLQRDFIFDAYNKEVSFNGFTFSENSLLESVKSEKIFIPFYAYKNREENKLFICGGRHRAQLLKQIKENIPFKFLCIYWDNIKNINILCDIIIPNILLNTSLQKMEVKQINLDNYFSIIRINNAIDLWLYLKAMDKEISYLLDFYKEKILTLNIYPPKDITWKEK